MRKILTFLFAALMSVGMWAETIEWNGLPGDGNSFSQGGVTLNCGYFDEGDLTGGGTFSTNLGNFTKIVITASSFNTGGGWEGDEDEDNKLIWDGVASSSVEFDGNIGGLSKIVFTIEPAAPAVPTPVVPSWVRDGDDWDEDTKTLTVNSDLPDEAYSYTEIEHVIISSGVTSIGTYAFEMCGNLTSITIPNGVTSIGEGAFYGSGLTSVTIPNSVTSIKTSVFAFCGNLSSIEIPNGVESIGWYAFRNCTGLTSITIPSSVTNIVAEAFRWCTNITDVYCYPNAADLTWNEDGCDDFKDNKETVCHVHGDQLSAYKSKFTGVVNVTFVGDLDAPTPTGFDITANLDPQNAGVYYSTFYHGSVDYALPANVKAYKAVISGSDLLLSEVAAEGDVLPKGNAVILRSSVKNYTLTPSDATPVSVGDDNDLEGTDDAIATPAKCYVLSCENNLVGFYQYGAANLNPHKAYVVFSGSNNAPRRMPFIFDAATGVENVQGNVQSTKVLRNGQLIIIRNGVEYNANGMMVK